jgi:hypothetical protein
MALRCNRSAVQGFKGESVNERLNMHDCLAGWRMLLARTMTWRPQSLKLVLKCTLPWMLHFSRCNSNCAAANAVSSSHGRIVGVLQLARRGVKRDGLL